MPSRKLLLKVCGMKNPENVQALVRIAPDFTGLIFYPKSPRFVGHEPALVLPSEFPESIKKVGVFVNADTEYILRMQKDFGLDYAQLHGSETPEQCEEIEQAGCRVIKVFSVGEDFDFSTLTSYEGKADYFLFDTKTKGHGGSGKKFNWDVLKAYPSSTPFFLSGGVDLDDLDDVLALDIPELAGLDINSRFELEPGLKDIDKVARLAKMLEE